ncbi:hypothetical protein HanRHA438_Chr13g0589681 [Helianthus annuus]|nr:hypothetical protein HanRHA438_Chr13g0589681 [Helianthus annuus]
MARFSFWFVRSNSRTKTIRVRYPNILSFLHGTDNEISDGSTTKVVVYIVTEPVTPLAEKIKELGLQGIQRYTVSLIPYMTVLLMLLYYSILFNLDI